MDLKKALPNLKFWAELLAAVLTGVATVAAFVPQARSLYQRIRTLIWPYVEPFAPYLWIGKWLLLAVTVFFGIIAYNRWKHRDSFITIVEDHLRLDLEPPNGVSGLLRQFTLLRADVNDVRSYRHLMWSSGGHDVPKITTKDYHSEVSKQAEVEGGMDAYELIFLPPLAKGRTVWQSFECHAIESFTEPREYFDHEVMYPKRKLTLEVVFPPDRQPKAVSAYRFRGGFTKVEGGLELRKRPTGETYVEWIVKRPPVGHMYRIEWLW